MPTHYEVLNVPQSASYDIVRKGFYSLALTHHPDKTTALLPHVRVEREQVFKAANTAWEILGDGVKRKAYDATLPATLPTTVKLPPQPPVRKPEQAPASTWKRSHVPEFNSKKTSTQTPNANRKSTRGSNANRGSGNSARPAAGATYTSANNPRPSAQGGFPFASPTANEPSFDSKTYHIAQSDCTIIEYKNTKGWNFRIDICKKFTLAGAPTFTPPRDTSISLDIVIQLQRARKTQQIDKEEVQVSVRGSPGNRHATLATRFEEHSGGTISLRITLSSTLGINLPRQWTFAFTADWDFAMPDSAKFGAASSMFHEVYPAHASYGGFGQSAGDKFPLGSPMAELQKQYPEMRFLNMANHEYCKQVEWNGKKFWQLRAIGYLI